MTELLKGFAIAFFILQVCSILTPASIFWYVCARRSIVVGTKTAKGASMIVLSLIMFVLISSATEIWNMLASNSTCFPAPLRIIWSTAACMVAARGFYLVISE